MKKKLLSVLALIAIIFASCGTKEQKQETTSSAMQKKVDEFAMVQLTTDVSKLNDKEKQLIGIFFDIAEIMDELFWLQSFGDKAEMEKNPRPCDTRFCVNQLWSMGKT
jgi:hypothetical protein